MKKIKWLLSILIICLTFALVGCGKSLAVPADLKVEDNILSWSEVENATNYVIEIGGRQYISAKTTYSLAMLSEGDYVIKIKARDAKGGYGDSEWSEEISYTKVYESGLVYTLYNSNTEYRVTHYGTARGNVRIEDTYKGKPVTAIAEKAFYGCGAITSIELGANIKTIGDKAFQNCSFLSSVTFPEGLTSIGEYAFQSCRALVSVELPSTLKTISPYVFRYCNKLTEVVMDGVESISTSAFEGCRLLTTLTLPDTVKSIGSSAFAQCLALEEVDLGNGVQTIADHAFYSCVKLTAVKGGDAITEIGVSAFEKCSELVSFNLGATVNTIGQSAFADCPALTDITINNNIASIGLNAFSNTAATEVIDGVIYAGNWVIGSDSSLTEVTFKEGVVGIGDYAFRASKIVRLRVPDTVKYIGNYAFYNCDSMNYLNIGSGVIDIGRYAFANCDVLGQGYVSLGTSLETIQAYAFYKSVNFGSPAYMGQNPITIPATVKSIGSYAFKETMFWNNTEKGEIVYVGNWAVGYIDDSSARYSPTIKEGIIGISDYAFYKCVSLDSITIGDSVSKIGIAAFYGCTNLSQVLLSNGSDLDYLADYMFYLCTNLQSVRLPVTLKTIGRSAFYKSGLMSITISKWIEEIGPYAFYGCSTLLAVNFEDLSMSRLTKIEDYAFASCDRLTRITLPDSVKEIGNRAFNKCTSLETVGFGNGLEVIDGYAFYYCSALSALELPDSLVTIDENAFYKCTALSAVDFGSGLKSIGVRAFYNCTALEKIQLPASLESIGDYAFKGCNLVTSVVLSDNINYVGMHAFYGCKFLTVYCEAESLPEGWSIRWNSGMRPAFWGCTLSEDKSTVVSFIKAKDNLINPNAKNGLSNPEREGYIFVGWRAVIDGEVKVFTFEEYDSIPENTELTAVWY